MYYKPTKFDQNHWRGLYILNLNEVDQLAQAYVRRLKNLKNIFPVSGTFSAKAHSIILLGFECTICPQNLIKIVGAIFEKIEIFFHVNCP